jgi:hypothetical protein
MPQIKQSVETITIENGEIKALRSNRTLSWGEEPPYVKMYLDCLLYLKDLPKGHTSILYELLKRMTFAGDDDGNAIFINSAMKNVISKKLGVSLSRINNVLSDLTKGELFYRIDRGMYRVNPNFFGKGEWQDIARLRLEVTFDANGKTVMGEVEKKTKHRETDNQPSLWPESEPAPMAASDW